MMTVNKVSKLTGVSVRTLHYYDQINLLSPAATTDSGYRLYDDAGLERLQQILLFKELGFSLKDIKKIIDSPEFDKKKAIAMQIDLLKIKKEHIENMLAFAEKIEVTGDYKMNFNIFDNTKIEQYKEAAKKEWGNTDAYLEYEKKTADYSSSKQELLAQNMMNIFKEFGKNKECPPESENVRRLVEKLQNFITENYYTCTDEILCSLGQMYGAGGKMTENIDAAGGKGTAEFAAQAIKEFCKAKNM